MAGVLQVLPGIFLKETNNLCPRTYPCPPPLLTQAVGSLASGMGPLLFAALFSAFSSTDPESTLPYMPQVSAPLTPHTPDSPLTCCTHDMTTLTPDISPVVQ